MRKNPTKCGSCQAAKRCVFKVRNSDNQEMLRTRSLLSEHNLPLALNGYAKQFNLRNTGADWRTLSSNETAKTPEASENITVH